MNRSTQPESGPPARKAADHEPSFGSRPLAGLASLAGQLPSQATPSEPAKPRKDVDGRSPLARALAGKIVISRESKGRAGKTVTFVRGIEASQAVLEALAKELRHELGSGVRVEDGALVVQGAMTDRLAASLSKHGAARIVIGN